jgi:hypothetical protein
VSLSIWTSCAGPSRRRPLALDVWRVVEAQHRVSTRSLVDTLEEQAILEDIIDGVKPPAPRGARFAGLNYLLYTPFRYPPLHRGSRFSRRDERSVFYAAQSVRTSLAEKAYYALLLVAGTRAVLEKAHVDWTAFQVGVDSQEAIDLTAPPFDEFRNLISSPSSYEASQALGSEMRAAGVELFRFVSARCPDRGVNVALFEPVFTTTAPAIQRTWRSIVTRESCEVFDLNSSSRTVLNFPRSLFEISGTLPRPAV